MKARLSITLLSTLAAGTATAGTISSGISWPPDPRPPRPPICLAPTLTQCEDPDYYTTTCGAQRTAFCQTLLRSSYQTRSTQLAAHKNVIEPDGMQQAGYVGDAHVIPFDPTQMSLASHAGDTYYAATLTTALDRLRAITSAPLPPTPEVTSCTDYVTKKFYDYSVFEAAAHACGTDDTCVYRTATSPAGLAKPTLYSLTVAGGVPMVPQIRIPSLGSNYDQAKNGFFEIAPFQILLASSYATSADARAIMAATPNVATGLPGWAAYHITDRWAWHQQMHDANALEQLTDDDYADAAQRMDAYRVKEEQLKSFISRLALAQQPGVGDNCGSVHFIPGSESLMPPDPDHPEPTGTPSPKNADSCTPQPPTQLQEWTIALINDMARDLMAEWNHKRNGVVDNGCLMMSSARCDWSPHRFRNEYVGRLREAREAAYGKCMTLTAGVMPTNPADRADWLALEAYFVRARQALEAQARDLPWAPGTDPNLPKTLRVAGPGGHDRIGIASILEGTYDVDSWWELTGKTTQAGALCSVDTEVSLHANATFDAPLIDALTTGPHLPDGSHTILDAAIDGKLNRGANALELGANLTLFDDPIVTLPTLGLPRAPFSFHPQPVERTEKLFEYQEDFDLFDVPLYLQLHVQGSAGYDIRIDFTPMPADNCAVGGLDASNLAGSETAYFMPDADVRATANVGVGVPGFLDIGVQGDVDVVRAHMPITQSLAVTSVNNVPTFTLDLNGHLTADLMSGALSIYADLLFDRVDKEIVHWSGIPLDQHFGTTLRIPLPLMNVAFEKNH